MNQFIFDKSYNKYWKARVEKASDGTKVPNDEIVTNLIKKLDIKNNEKVLDLGCGYGRIFPELNKYTNLIYGIDIDPSMVNDASITYDYRSLHTAPAEDTKYPNDYFDKIIVFGVFDVVDQEKSLLELNRILKPNGKCLITGKNADYCIDDEKAFIAEKNAKLKNFPNHFTDVKKMIENISIFGFSYEELNIFIKRGDFGENKIVKVESDWISNFYEYCIFLKKETEPTKKDILFAEEYSHTARKKATIYGETDMIKFFKDQTNI